MIYTIAICLTLTASSSQLETPIQGSDNSGSSTLLPSEENVPDLELIKKESAPGGKFDFTEQFPRTSLHAYKGVAYNSRQRALIAWAEAVEALGVDYKQAKALYEEIYTTELSKNDLRALKAAFK